jgi:6,7-dimethyl-8-ribityllumazine synthase
MTNRLNNPLADVKVIEGNYNLPTCTIAIVASKFNEFIVDKLIKGCIDTLLLHNVDAKNIQLISVPGAMEIPLAVQNVAKNKNIDGIVALGAVIRGATAHFDFVAGECMSGLSKLSLEYNKPIACGVLTTENIEQAIERAGSKAGNKGSEAALTVISMVSLIKQLGAEV